MVVKMSSPGRSFGGVADYCLHDPRLPGEAHPESAERVEWTETRNLATSEGERSARIMAATAEAGPELKRLAGVAATGRKLEKPVCHYSLSWAKDERPDRQEMRRAAQESLKALGMERHQALIVSHRDGQPHVHVIANRVDPESGKAAGLSRSKLRLSKWAEGYEREQGKIRCPQRERNNRQRSRGERVVDGRGHSGGRWRRERMNPQREQREAIPAKRDRWERERVAWQRAEERGHWARYQRGRGKALGDDWRQLEFPTTTIGIPHFFRADPDHEGMVKDQQVRRLVKLRKNEKMLTMAAAKAGLSRKTARKYLKSRKLPSQCQPERYWRTRSDPFESVWPEVEKILKRSPTVEATAVFEHLCRQQEGAFQQGQLRTLQRRIKQWKAAHGEAKEVMFPQKYRPGHQAQSDFTFMGRLGVTIQGQPFPHLLYHFVLAYSNWEATTLCFSESFESLSLGLQNELWELGARCPRNTEQTGSRRQSTT